MPTTCRYSRWHFSPRKVPAPEIPANSTIPLTNSRYADGMPERRRVKSRQELGRRRPPCPRREILEAHLSPCRKPKLPALGVYPEASLKRVRRAAHARPTILAPPYIRRLRNVRPGLTGNRAPGRTSPACRSSKKIRFQSGMRLFPAPARCLPLSRTLRRKSPPPEPPQNGSPRRPSSQESMGTRQSRSSSAMTTWRTAA